MSVVNQYFEQRVAEVDRYFKFLKLLDEPGVGIHRPQRTRRQVATIESELHPMLKASSFLVLYNLIESTIRKAFDEVYGSVGTDGVYKDVTVELRAQWIRHRCRPLRDPSTNMRTIERVASQLIDDALSGKPINLGGQSDWLRGGGNLDAQKIRELCDDHGIRLEVNKAAKGGHELSTVKSKRNSLAHGDELFSEVGRDYTYTQLEKIKQQVILYMRSVLRNFDEFAKNRSYLDAS